MSVEPLLAPDGRCLVVAVDHPLYSWPCEGLEDRRRVLGAVAEAGADALIASYGTIRDLRDGFGRVAPILKLDLTTLSVGGRYPVSEYAQAYTVGDAERLGAAAVLTYVQLGTPFELEALRIAAGAAAAADKAGLAYVCEIMPVESDAYPDPAAPTAIAAAARTAAELGAHVVKTTMPSPPEGMREVGACGVPVILAGGEFEADERRLLDHVSRALDAGAAGVAYGRNVWGRADPGRTLAALRSVVHPSSVRAERDA